MLDLSGGAAERSGELAVINHEGDTKITWNKSNDTEVEAARRAFDYLKEKGHSFFKMSASGEQRGDRLRDFDPDAERIIAVPRMVGG
jgi:hypothetical protein